MTVDPDVVARVVGFALDEDLGTRGDITSDALCPGERRIRGRFVVTAVRTKILILITTIRTSSEKVQGAAVAERRLTGRGRSRGCLEGDP